MAVLWLSCSRGARLTTSVGEEQDPLRAHSQLKVRETLRDCGAGTDYPEIPVPQSSSELFLVAQICCAALWPSLLPDYKEPGTKQVCPTFLLPTSETRSGQWFPS